MKKVDLRFFEISRHSLYMILVKNGHKIAKDGQITKNDQKWPNLKILNRVNPVSINFRNDLFKNCRDFGLKYQFRRENQKLKILGIQPSYDQMPWNDLGRMIRCAPIIVT